MKFSPYAPYRSKWESEYAQRLRLQVQANEIWGWEYEPDTLILAYHTSYTPDFKVFPTRETFEYHEVKGWSRNLAAGMVKLKVAAQQNQAYAFYLVKKDAKLGWKKTRVRTLE